MMVYKKVKILELREDIIDSIYESLLKHHFQFVILEVETKLYVLTKERSIFKIEKEETFLKTCEQDQYYQTILEQEDKNNMTDFEDIALYRAYIEKYKERMKKRIYGKQYIFGSVAVKTKQGFITTLRGKKDLEEYTVVRSVDHKQHVVYAITKKATLNAPLLDYLFQNTNAKVIVHINHEYDISLPYESYAFPGTQKDSIRMSKTSFNIQYHGLFYLFDQEGKLMKEEKNEVSKV